MSRLAPHVCDGAGREEAATASTTTVLAIGSALAVLVVGAGATPAERDGQAQAALRRATGRTDISISRRPSGRPRLEQPYPELGVSLSHRGDLLLAACSPNAAAGTDLEIDTRDLDPVRLAVDHFAQAEAAALVRLDADAARDAFLRLWVAKEAALKLTGRGIHDGLGEPDCAHLIEALARDGADVALGPSARLPALRLAVCRVSLPGRPAIYCALAVQA